MSEPEAAEMHNLAAALGDLARRLDVVPQISGEVSQLSKRVTATNLVNRDIAEMALAACEAELRSMKALARVIHVLSGALSALPLSPEQMEEIAAARQELDTGRVRIERAMDVVASHHAAADAAASHE